MRKTGNHMFELVYYSIANPDFTEPEIIRMLEIARKQNGAQEITGCLLYHKGVFVQLLEGKKPDVETLYQKIAADQRHNHVTLLAAAEKEKRMFNSWDMAFVPLNEDEASALSRQMGDDSAVNVAGPDSPLHQLKQQDASHVLWVFHTFSKELLAS